MPERKEIESHLPLTETTALIMLSLARGPKHGYAIIKDVEALSEERVNLSSGTLYGALSRLLDDGWIARCEKETDEERPGRPRKTYALTKLGQRVLQAEMERMRGLLAMASREVAREGIS